MKKNFELLDARCPWGSRRLFLVDFNELRAKEAALRRLDFPYMGIASELFECALLAIF